MDLDTCQLSLKFLEPPFPELHQADSFSVAIPLPNQIANLPPFGDLVFPPICLDEGHRAQDLKLRGGLLGLLLLVVAVEFSQILLFHRLNGVVPAGAGSREIHLRVVAAGKVLIRVIGLTEARTRFEEVVLLRRLDVERLLEDLKRTLLLLFLRAGDWLRFGFIKNVGLVLLLLNNVQLCLRLLGALQLFMRLIPMIILFPGRPLFFGEPIVFHQRPEHGLLNFILECILVDLVSDFIGVEILNRILLKPKLLAFHPAVLANFDL